MLHDAGILGLLEVNTVTLLDKTERAGIANISFVAGWLVGFGSGTCCFTKTAFNHVRLPLNFQSS